MNRIACFDLDGVSLHEHEPFSRRLIQKQGEYIASAVNEFFDHEFGLVMIGQADLSESLEPYLERFGWHGDVESLLAFWFEGEKDPNLEVLTLAKRTKDQGVPTYIVTDNPKDRIQTYWDDLLQEYFTGRYVSGETGLKKSSPNLWTVIANELNVAPENIFFTDDSEKKTEVAKSAGVHAVQFTTVELLDQQLQDFVS